MRNKFTLGLLLFVMILPVARALEITPESIELQMDHGEHSETIIHLSNFGFNGSTIAFFSTNLSLPITLSHYSIFIDDSTNKTVDVEIDVPLFHEPETINGTIVIINGVNTTIIPISVDILNKINISYPDNLTINLTTGAETSISIIMNNTGNNDINFNVTLSEFLSGENTFTSYRGYNIPYLIKVQTEHNTIPAIYNEKINFTNQELNYSFEIPVFLSVTDVALPKLNVTHNKTYNYLDDVKIFLNATDNINVSTVKLHIMYPDNTKKDVFVDNNVYILSTDVIGNYSVDIIVNDTSNNKIIRNIEFQVLELDILDFDAFIDIGKIKSSSTRLFTLGHVFKQVDLEFTVINYTETPVVIDIYSSRIDINETIKIGAINDVDMRIIGVQSGKVELDIIIKGPDYIKNSNKTIRLVAEFVDYEPFDDFDDSWLGYSVICSANDTGILEESAYTCCMKFPITTDFETLTLPVAPSWKTTWENNYESQIMSLKNIMFWQGVSWWINNVVIFLIATAFFFMEYYYPRYSSS